MDRLNPFSGIKAKDIQRAAEQYGTPLYLYDEKLILDKCRTLTAMPHAYGLTVRYAMKANSGRALLQIIRQQGLRFDASSLNEARRAVLAGAKPEDIMLTTQEVPMGGDRAELERLLAQGMQYNACSLRQLYEIGDFAASKGMELGIRIHPGVGAGETVTRNTGDKYSCFGIHLSDLKQAAVYAEEKGIPLTHAHVHIGSGGEPEAWRQNIDLELGIIEQYFPRAHTVSFGGGLKEARMPDETSADVPSLGTYAKEAVERFYARTGRKLKTEIEPGTFVVANAGYVVTEVMDKKRTGEDGFLFLVADGGMEMNARPLFYASRHPFYCVTKQGELRYSDFQPVGDGTAIVVGRCCESGDAQSLDADGQIIPRRIVEPDIGDYLVIGGAGAYCSSMAPMNYNSHVQAPEVLLTETGGLRLIRKKQTLEQIVANELDL